MKVKKLNESAALTEETLEDVVKKEVAPVAKTLNADVENWDGPYGDVESALDRALKKAKIAEKRGRISGNNVLLIGRAGTGKTERIKEWAKQRGIQLVFADVQSMDPTDLGGIMGRDDDDPKYSTRLGNREFWKLDKPNSVLFLDEINRGSKEVIGSLLTLVQNHLIVDPGAPGGKRPLKGMLFTIAAMNPFNPAYQTNDIDSALRTRFRGLKIEPDNDFQAKFFDKFFAKELSLAEKDGDPDEIQEVKGQYALAKKIITAPEFRFDNDDEEAAAKDASEASLNPRTLTECILACDGTKEDFLDLFPEICNPAKLEMVEDILADYVDVDDEANAALAWGDDDPFAQKQSSLFDMIGGDSFLNGI